MRLFLNHGCSRSLTLDQTIEPHLRAGTYLMIRVPFCLVKVLCVAFTDKFCSLYQQKQYPEHPYSHSNTLHIRNLSDLHS